MMTGRVRGAGTLSRNLAPVGAPIGARDMTARRLETIHATALALGATGPAGDGAGLLLRGPSGSGKSDLALRMIAGGTARLVADDRVVLWPGEAGDAPRLACPEGLAGSIEIRGLGIVSLDPHEWVAGTSAPSPDEGTDIHAPCLRLVVDLVDRSAVPRLPMPSPAPIAGAWVPRLRLHAFDLSTPTKILRAVSILRARAAGLAGDGGEDEDGLGMPGLPVFEGRSP